MDGVLTNGVCKGIRQRLVRWYRRNARELPWRESRDPYRVWISEIMLQQTQVATVEGYFRRFLDAFPTIASLAAADEQQVLRLWEGLGYYRRARNLHAAAKKIVSEHKGQFPNDRDQVHALPGVGRYTAGAILSIAFDAREPILEANTVRLFSRLIGFRGDVQTAEGQKLLWQTAECLLPARRGSGLLNQALMELGSRVCTPREPNCAECPLAEFCSANRANLQHSIPLPKRRSAPQDITEAAVVVRHRGRMLLRRYDNSQRWAGLWDFPRFEVHHTQGLALRKELAEKVQSATGILVSPSDQITALRHGVTRYRITLQCHVADYVSGTLLPDRELRWVRPAQLEQLPLNTTGRKISRLLLNTKIISRSTRAVST